MEILSTYIYGGISPLHFRPFVILFFLKASEAVQMDDECAASKFPQPSSHNHAEEHHTGNLAFLHHFCHC